MSDQAMVEIFVEDGARKLSVRLPRDAWEAAQGAPTGEAVLAVMRALAQPSQRSLHGLPLYVVGRLNEAGTAIESVFGVMSDRDVARSLCAGPRDFCGPLRLDVVDRAPEWMGIERPALERA